MKNYIGINEFAELAGVSKESVYKRIRKKDNPINEFVNHADNPLTIDKDALFVLYNVKVEEATSELGSKVHEPLQEQKRITEPQQKKEEVKEPSTTLTTIFQNIIESQRQDIEQKNLQIKELNARLEESQRALDQQQKLSLADKQTILTLQSAVQERKHKGLFFGLFGRKED